MGGKMGKTPKSGDIRELPQWGGPTGGFAWEMTPLTTFLPAVSREIEAEISGGSFVKKGVNFF